MSLALFSMSSRRKTAPNRVIDSRIAIANSLRRVPRNAATEIVTDDDEGDDGNIVVASTSIKKSVAMIDRPPANNNNEKQQQHPKKRRLLPGAEEVGYRNF
jgi:hypothetical protein